MDTNGIWIPLREFDARTMSQDKDILINYFAEIDFLSKAFRFIVETNQVQNDNNRGRVVIGDIRVIRNHTNTYHSPYISVGDAGHLSTCSCGATTLQLHIAGPHEHGDRYDNCMRCNYLIDLWNGGPIIVIPNNNQNHDEYYHKSIRGIYDMIDVYYSKEIAIIHKMEESYENY